MDVVKSVRTLAGGLALAILVAGCTMSTWRMGVVKRSSYAPDEGRYITFDSRIFSAKSMMTGILRPEKFAKVYEVSVFLMGPHAPGKIPVVLVHGHTHGPRPFEKLVDAMDRDRFEPWIVLYPSGQKLAWTVSMLRESLSRTASENGVDRVAVLGFSMGGMVTRKALGQQLDGVEMPSVPLYIGVAPAFGGLDMDLGIEKPKLAPPSWDDIPKDAPFMVHLFDDPLPEETEMHIIYGLLDEGMERIPGPDDGALAESSMARPEAVAEASSVTVIEDVGHGDVIEHPDTIARVNELLAGIVEP